MFVATFLCDPAKPTLDPALVESLRNAWGGGDVIWLAADEAAEFGLSQMPENAGDVWQVCQDQGVDMIIQPVAGRRKKMLIADMDSTVSLDGLPNFFQQGFFIQRKLRKQDNVWWLTLFLLSQATCGGNPAGMAPPHFQSKHLGGA